MTNSYITIHVKIGKTDWALVVNSITLSVGVFNDKNNWLCQYDEIGKKLICRGRFPFPVILQKLAKELNNHIQKTHHK